MWVDILGLTARRAHASVLTNNTQKLRACANRSWSTAGSPLPTEANPGFSDEPAQHDDHLGGGDPQGDDAPPAFGAPHQLLVGVVPRVGAFHHPTFPDLHMS